MTSAEAAMRYMRAHIRNTTGHLAREWTPEEVMDSFALLAPPAVDFQSWLRAIGASEQPSSIHDAGEWPDNWREENQALIDSLKQSIASGRAPKIISLQEVA